MKQTSSRSGNTPNVTALLIINGIASVPLHTPTLLSPTICPILNTLACTPAPLAAAPTILSVTSFDLAYPIPCACASSGTCVSLILAGSGVPAAAEIELQKKKRAGRGVCTDRHRRRKLCAPAMWCVSNEATPMLKFTAQALWTTAVRVLRRWESVAASRPRSGQLKSLGRAVTFESCTAEGWRLRCAREVCTRASASAGDGARTRQ